MRLLSALALVLLSACGANPHWTQSHGGATNASFAPTGPRTIPATAPFAIGAPGAGEPVELPDHRVLVPVNLGGAFPVGRLVVLDLKSGSAATFADFTGMISTPAIDSAGNAYVISIPYVHCSGPSSPGTVVSRAAYLIKLSPTGAQLWNRRIAGTCGIVPSPKLVEQNGHVSLFFAGMANGVGPIVASDENGNLESIPYGVCASPGPGKAVDVPLPWPDDPGFAIGEGGDGQIYLVQAADKCGLFFYRLSLRPTNQPTWPANLLYPTPVGTVSASSTVGTPAISAASGYTIAKIGSSLKAFQTSSGKPIKKWSIDIGTGSGAPPTIALNSVLYFDQAGRLYSRAISPLGTAPVQSGNAYSAPSSLVASTSRIYVADRYGLHVLDTSLQEVANSLGQQDSGGGLALLSDNTLVFASRNGNTLAFPAK